MSPGTSAFARVRARTLLALLVIATAALCVGAGSASAAFTPTGFSATPTSLQAAGHGDLNISATLNGASAEQSGDDLRQLQIELPAGQLLNPRAVAATCTDAQYGSDTCPSASVVGSITVKFRFLGQLRTATGSVYELAATSDSPLNFGFIVRPSGIQKLWFKSSKVSGMTSVRSGPDGDYGLTITIPQIPYLVKDAIGLQYPITIYDLGIKLNQKAPSGKYFVFNPTRCEAATAKAAFTSVRGQTFSQSSAWAPNGCSNVKFDPIVTVGPTVSAVGAATGINAEFRIDTADAAIQRSHMRDIAVALPEGTTLNLDVLNATAECSEAQISLGSCPEASKVGTAAIDVPFLTSQMTGGIYLNTTGDGVRFVVIVNGPNGTQATFRALSKPASVDGGSTILTTFTGLPQAPYSRAQLDFTSKLVNNPDRGCPNSWASISAAGYSGSSYGAMSLHALTGCVPNTVITNPVATPTRNNRPAVNFVSDIPGATFKCRLDSGGWEDCASPYTPPTALADGLHRIVVRAFFAGIGDYTPATTSFTVDTVAPVVDFTAPAADSTVYGDTVKFEWTSSDGVAARCALLPHEYLEDCSNGKTYTGVEPGEYTVFLSVRDAAGNWRPTFRTINVIASADPVVTITSPTMGEQLDRNKVRPIFTATSPVSSPIVSTYCEIQTRNGNGWDYESNIYSCESGDLFSNAPSDTEMRLVVTTTDEESREGTASVIFRTGKRDPFRVDVEDGPISAVTNDRTPSFELSFFEDPLYTDIEYRCAFVPAGSTARPWIPCTGGRHTSPETLTYGEWTFIAQSVSGDRQSFESSYSFEVAPWNPSYSATTSTTAAGAHPDLDVNIDVPSGQLRKVDMLMPKGLIGSLNSFEECAADVIVNPRNCPAGSKIGTVSTLITLQGLNLARLPGTVYLTAPQVAGDAAGIVIIIPKPVGGYADVVIPMRLQLVNNSGNMRVFSDSIPTEVERFEYGMYDYYVHNFKMHLNGSQGSPFPLLSNPTSCTSSQFSTVIGALDGEEAPAQTVPFATTDCDQLTFAPQFKQTFGNLEASHADGLPQYTDVVADLTLPSGSAAPASFVVREPSLLSPNYGSFGEQVDQCNAGAVTDIDPGPAEVLSFRHSATNCPTQAKVGMMTIDTPLLKTPLTGDIYWVQRSPIPYLGVNLNNDRFNLNLVGEVIVEGGRIKVQFSSIPDVPLTSAKVSLNLPNRTGKAGQQISGKLLAIGQSSDSSCIPGSTADTTMKSQSGLMSQLAQPIAFTGCGDLPE